MQPSAVRFGTEVQTSVRRVTAVVATTLALAIAPLTAAPAAGHLDDPAGPLDGVSSTPWDRSGEPPRTLRDGVPAEAGLVAEHLDPIGDVLDGGTRDDPLAFSGAVALVARDGVVALHESRGHAVRFADDAPTELPAAQWRATADDTIFDLASLTKLFTTIAVMQLVEDGALDLDRPVAVDLPRFATGGKQDVTVRHLLTHTGGLPAWLPLWSAYDRVEDRIDAALTATATSAPGTTRVYSDIGFIALGELVEAVTGESLDAVIAANITDPLGMGDTGFRPSPDDIERIAATEYQPLPDRGLVHGEAHDENAWALGGVAGHAGLFATAHDVAILGQTLLNGGHYGDARVLAAATIEDMMAEQLLQPGASAGQGLGFERGQRWLQDAMWSPDTVSHTGFTGTSLVIDPHTDVITILLTNRVHPSREGPSINPERRAVARAAARAVPVQPRTRGAAWFSGTRAELDATLELHLDLPDGDSRLDLDLWYDLPEDAQLRVEARSGGDDWQLLPGVLRAGDRSRPTTGVLDDDGERRWWQAGFDLPGHNGPTGIRVAVTSDGLASGRGVYVDHVRVEGPRGRPLFDDRLPRDLRRWQSDGWTRAAD